MRRSLGGGRGRPMGGGSGSIRAFQRAVVGGAPPTTTANIGGAKTGIANNRRSTSPNTALTLFSPSFSSTLNLPVPAASAWISSSSSTDESDWEYVHIAGDEPPPPRGFYDFVFGTVPSSDEVHHALSALQQAVGSSSDSHPKAKLADCQMDWFEPSHNLYSSKALQRPSTDVVSEAFHLLETEPSVQKMVVSLSSDKAVWDAVLNNEVVRELRGSIHRVASLVGECSGSSSSDPDEKGNILSWVVMFAKSKMMQLLDLITKLVNNVLGPDKKGDDGLDGRVKNSFFLSIIVLLVVILARTKTTNA